MNRQTLAQAPDRRRLLQGSLGLAGLGLLGGCTTVAGGTALSARAGPDGSFPRIAPVRASLSRLFDITVCLRPFRAAGPRLDVERIGDTLVVHNYGHGGSGWSLSWGSGTIAVQKAMAGGAQDIAVIGCGALGLTAAILAQRAGARVTIYAKDLLPETRSARATGSWTPDSRIALAKTAGPAFGDLWEQMARTSFKTYRQYLGLPGTPVEWIDRYYLSDLPPGQSGTQSPADALDFADYEDRIRDLGGYGEPLPTGSTPFPTPYVRRGSTLMFNIADYGRTLMGEFRQAGGTIVRREFHAPSEIAALPQKAVINCPGYAARALWRDESVAPVRGQIAWLIPQPEVTYQAIYKHVNMLPRRDGIVLQSLAGGDMQGYGDDHEVPDRAEAEQAVRTIAELYDRMAGGTASSVSTAARPSR